MKHAIALLIPLLLTLPVVLHAENAPKPVSARSAFGLHVDADGTLTLADRTTGSGRTMPQV